MTDIMTELFDQEEVLRSYVESEKHDEKLEMAKRLLKMEKLSIEEIAVDTGLSVEEVEDMAGLPLV